MKHSNTIKYGGFSLIEVLVTVLILGTSLLAIAALQTRSLDYNHSAYLRSQANVIAYDVLDRIRSVSPQTSGIQNPALSEPILSEIENRLPEGEINVACIEVSRVCTVSVTWAEQDGLNEGGKASTFTYTTRL